ncbi:MAG TPA: hypothetical protein VER33_12450, partial [Polyangiaceae bacterium]|nr:hypothetical protein [Polyangiaceae bacterium]
PLYQEADGRRAVTDEVSCRGVQPHRARAATLAITSTSVGVRAPSLASFPQLVVPDIAAASALAERPKLLGVDFAADPASAARVFVGTTQYARALAEPAAEAELIIDPASAQQHSLVLPFNEPRAYPQTDDVRLEYEGPLTETRPGGLFRVSSEGVITLDDPGTWFCDRGVHDPSLMQQLGEERFGLTGPALTSFATDHADHVVVTADFPEPDDRYWSVNRQQCSYSECEELFGGIDEDQLSVNREFSIVDAEQQRLTLTSRGEFTPAQLERWSPAEAVNCCFPSGTAYVINATRQWVVRGSSTGLRHDVMASWVTTEAGDSVLDCVRDENPRKRYFESRVFEIAADGPCAHEDMSRAVRLDEAAARCIHHTPTARFAVYRGTRPSIRGMTFAWRTLGGFSPLAINLAAITSVVSPQAIVGLPEMDWLTVVDAATLGLTLVSLDELSVLTPTLN